MSTDLTLQNSSLVRVILLSAVLVERLEYVRDWIRCRVGYIGTPERVILATTPVLAFMILGGGIATFVNKEMYMDYGLEGEVEAVEQIYIDSRRKVEEQTILTVNDLQVQTSLQNIEVGEEVDLLCTLQYPTRIIPDPLPVCKSLDS